MRFSSIAITALVSMAVASPLFAQSAMVPRSSGHVPKVTSGSNGVLVFRHAPRRHGYNRGNGFGFGTGFVFGDAKGFGIGHADRNDRYDHRWHGRHWSRHGDHGDEIYGYGGGYDDYYGSYVSTPPAPDQFGFFGNGGEATLVDGRAVYDYDRSYPYEHFRSPRRDYYRAPRREEAMADGASARRSVPGCETEWVPDGHGGGDVPVRICRR